MMSVHTVHLTANIKTPSPLYSTHAQQHTNKQFITLFPNLPNSFCKLRCDYRANYYSSKFRCSLSIVKACKRKWPLFNL